MRYSIPPEEAHNGRKASATPSWAAATREAVLLSCDDTSLSLGRGESHWFSAFPQD